MKDLISRQRVLKLLSTMPPEEAITQAMLIQSVKQMSAADCISRRAALDAFTDALNDVGALDAEDINTVLQMLPSAQPEKRTEKRTETHACDCISRKAAIEAITDLPTW